MLQEVPCSMKICGNVDCPSSLKIRSRKISMLHDNPLGFENFVLVFFSSTGRNDNRADQEY